MTLIPLMPLEKSIYAMHKKVTEGDPTCLEPGATKGLWARVGKLRHSSHTFGLKKALIHLDGRIADARRTVRTAALESKSKALFVASIRTQVIEKRVRATIEKVTHMLKDGKVDAIGSGVIAFIKNDIALLGNEESVKANLERRLELLEADLDREKNNKQIGVVRSCRTFGDRSFFRPLDTFRDDKAEKVHDYQAPRIESKREYESISWIGPVGEPQSIAEFKKHYYVSEDSEVPDKREKCMQGLDLIDVGFQMVRIAGDGHCLFRSIGTELISLIKRMTPQEEDAYMGALSTRVRGYNNAKLSERFAEVQELMTKAKAGTLSLDKVIHDRESSDTIVAFLRSLACEHNRVHNQHFENVVTIMKASDTVEIYVKRMSDMKEKEYGTWLEARAIAEALQFNIRVLDMEKVGRKGLDQGSDRFFAAARNGQPADMTLLFTQNHYSVLTPRAQAPAPAATA